MKVGELKIEPNNKKIIMIIVAIFLFVHILFEEAFSKESAIFDFSEIKNIRAENPHVILQLTGYDEKSVISLKNSGIWLITPRNSTLWEATISGKNIDKIALNKHILNVMKPSAEEKIKENIQKGSIPQHSVRSRNVYVFSVGCYKDLSAYYCKKAIEKHGKVVGVLAKYAYIVEIKKKELLPLANEDEIRIIEENFPPATETLEDSRVRILANYSMDIYKLDGSDVNISMWEATGIPNLNHADLIKRVTYDPSEVSVSADHATIVAGVMAGNGSISNLYRGIAQNAKIRAHDTQYHTHDSEIGYDMSDKNGVKSLISQNSWADSVNSSQCERYGNYYANQEEILDDTIRGNRYAGKRISIVYAAGNERDDGDCNLDSNPYNSTPTPATAKNIITVGAVSSDNIRASTCFSSWGPTDDGRLKPEIVAPGDEGACEGSPAIEFYLSPSTLTSSAGTSFAAPQVSGAIALMQQQAKCTFDNVPLLPSTTKAVLIHTATDVNTTGPDYRTGYGLLNVTGAVDAVIYRKFRENSLSSITETDKWNFTIVSGEPQAKVTLAWDDVAGQGLKNDLDLTLISPTGTHYHSWYLNPDNPSAVAVADKGDHLNNIEQVIVNNPTAGEWTIVVNTSQAVLLPPQNYSLVYKKPFSILMNSPNFNQLISIPIDPYNSSPDSIFCRYMDNSQGVVWTNNGSSWFSYVCDRSTNTILNVTVGSGYWVNASTKFEFEIYGNPTNKDIIVNGAIPGGSHPMWPIIGYNSFMYMPVNDFISSKPFNAIRKVEKPTVWGKETWQTHYPSGNEPANFFNMKPGIGYEYKTTGPFPITLQSNPTRSCSLLTEEVISLATSADLSLSTSSTPSSPFTIYGNISCERLLNYSDLSAKITLKVGSLNVSNYTMGELNDSRYRVDVPMEIAGGAEVGDSGRLHIGGMPVNEGNVTIGNAGNSTIFNITVNTTDSDGDGYSAQCLDCNDANASILPGAIENCDFVDNNCNGYIDEGCPGLRVTSLNEIKNETKSKLFEFRILNVDNENLNDILWTVDLGDDTTINSTLESSLDLYEDMFVFLIYNYSYTGVFNVTANVSSLAANNNEYYLLLVDSDLWINNFMEILINSTRRIFSFEVINSGENSLSNVSWNFDTGNGLKLNSTANTNLSRDERFFVFVNHNYTGTGNFSVNASATNNSLAYYTMLNIGIT